MSEIGAHFVTVSYGTVVSFPAYMFGHDLADHLMSRPCVEGEAGRGCST